MKRPRSTWRTRFYHLDVSPGSQTASHRPATFNLINLAGVKLVVKPTVNADRRITLKVKPEVSTPGAASSRILNFPPTVNTRNAETTVVLRDGETIAIGGLIEAKTSPKQQPAFPLLMSIPVIGYLFKTARNLEDSH